MFELVVTALAEALIIVFKTYFKLLEKLLNGVLKDFGIKTKISVFPETGTGIDERIAKIDEARKNLVDSLQLVDELRSAATENKQELESAISHINQLQVERKLAEEELTKLRELASVDTTALRTVIGIPSSREIWRERFFGFLSGILASTIATGLWLVGSKIF